MYKLSIKKKNGGSGVKKLLEKVKGFYSHPNILCVMVPPAPLIIDCDASPSLGTVLSHNYQDNFERPIVYTSRTLSQAEMLFTNLKIVFGSYKHFLKNFMVSLYGWGSTTSRLVEPLQGGSLLLTTKFPENFLNIFMVTVSQLLLTINSYQES